MKMMLVDDSRNIRGIEKQALRSIQGDIKFVEAGDGLEALGKLSAGPFDLILVDWNMPIMDGLTLVGRIRQIDRKTPLIMVTTEADREHVLEAIRAGVNNYVIKPFTAESLLQKVRVTLEKAAA